MPLPYYRRLSEPWTVLRSSISSLARFWRALGGVDRVWLLGPHPLGLAFAALAAVRRSRVVLGVRQDFPPTWSPATASRRSLRLAAASLERSVSLPGPPVPGGRRRPGDRPHYARRTRAARDPGLAGPERDLVAVERARSPPLRRRAADDQRRAAGRGEEPAAARRRVGAPAAQDGDRWRLIVCGEGPLQATLEDRLRELGVAERAELRGYVPYGPGSRLYRTATRFLHVSWTEGLPQVLMEAFAAGLPVVATDVGGVAAAVGDAVRLVPPGDAGAAASALGRSPPTEACEGLVAPVTTTLRRGPRRRGEARRGLPARRVSHRLRVVPAAIGEGEELTSSSRANAAIRWAALYSGWQAVSTSRS